MKVLCTLLLMVLLLAVSAQTRAACSPYLGRATVNEVYKLSQGGGGGPGLRFIEFKLLDTGIPASVYAGWSVGVCADQTQGGGTTTYCTNVPLSAATVTLPYLVIDQGDIGSNYFNVPDGMDVVLRDGNGDAIDYVSVAGYTRQSVSCPYYFDTTANSNGRSTFDVFREPDGTGEWDQEPGNSGPVTEGAPNTENPGEPNLSITNVTVFEGQAATFTVTLDAPATRTVEVDYRTLDGTAQAGVHYTAASGTLTIPPGATQATFSIQTLDGPATTDVYFNVLLSGAENAIVLTHYATATIQVGGALQGFSITPGSTNASTCAPVSVTFTALDGGGAILNDYTGTVAITTSSGHGNWAVNTAAQSLVPSPDSDDNGSVGYTFAAADKGSMILDLSNTHADDLTITVADTSAGVSATSGVYRFRDNTFVITEDPVQVAGRDQTMTVTMWRKDPATGNCLVATDYQASAQSLKAWLVRDGADPGGAAPAIGGSSLPGTPPALANISLDFSANPGRAAFAMSTTDVGKYVLYLRDATRTYAQDVDITGATGIVTTRPFGLGVSAYQGATANPAGTASSGTKFVAAADPFSVAVGAYLWNTADDANDDGIPDTGTDISDNGLTPSFAWDTALEETAPYTPAAPAAPVLSGSLVLGSGGYAGGQASAAGIKYAEAGSFTLRAVAGDYLNTPGLDVTGTAVVGRFHPYGVSLESAAVTPGCAGFTYMGQGTLGLQLSLTARNKDGAVTALYDGAKGYAFTASLAWVAENGNDGNDLGARVTAPALGWTDGTGTLDTAAARFVRAAAPDGRFGDLQLGIRLVDPQDGVALTAHDMNAATANDCAADAANPCDGLGVGAPQDLRFGRLVLENAFGSEYQPLAVPFYTQYFVDQETGFVTSGEDGCTTVDPATQLALSNPQTAGGAPQPGTAPMNVGSGTSSAGIANAPFLGGSAGLALSPPGSTGYIDIAVDASAAPWLLFDWDGDGAHDNGPPPARAVFGQYRGNDRIIYWREVFQ